MAVFASAALMLLVGPTLVRGEGIRYARIPGSRNWRQSRAACAAAGGRLPVILDAPANARVTNFMGESGIGHAHIGLIDISIAQPAPRIWQWCVLLACTLFTGWKVVPVPCQRTAHPNHEATVSESNQCGN